MGFNSAFKGLKYEFIKRARWLVFVSDKILSLRFGFYCKNSRLKSLIKLPVFKGRTNADER